MSDTMFVKDLRRDLATPGVLICAPANVEAASRWLDRFGASSCVGDYHCPRDWGWVVDKVATEAAGGWTE